MSYSLVLPVHCLAFGKYRYLHQYICACVPVCLSVFMLRCVIGQHLMCDLHMHCRQTSEVLAKKPLT